MATKSELIADVAKKARVSEALAESAMDILLTHMVEALAKGQKVEIRGLGSWVPRSYKAREGRNPRTGGKVFVKAKRLPHFKIGKELKARMDAVFHGP